MSERPASAFDPALLAQLRVPVQRLQMDSRRIQPGDIFVATRGERVDARLLIPQAIHAGAAGVIWEAAGFHWDATWQVPNIGVLNLQLHLGEIAAHIYDHPSRKLWVAGVTGTNGKTSCSHWIAQSLNRVGKRAAVIGTLGNGFPGALSQPTHTTPDAISLQTEMASLVTQGATHLAMEVSSHGLEQGRVNGAAFQAALFTNLSRDHLDYHISMDRYAAAKRKLFEWPGLRHAIVNIDDEFGQQLAASLHRGQVNVLGYGLGKGEISGHRLDLSKRGLNLEIKTPWGAARIQSALLGGYNASNLLGVLGTLLVAEIGIEDAARVLELAEPVPGRMQMVRRPGRALVVVDYAHTPDALEKVLRSLREILDDAGRLICVFGCGGERDPGKRPLMGEVATRLADRAIITSDNPRGEDPLAIIDAIIAGAHANHHAEPDRATAIHDAVRQARPDDVVLIAGKGHEPYQEIAGRRLPFSDAEVAARALEATD